MSAHNVTTELYFDNISNADTDDRKSEQERTPEDIREHRETQRRIQRPTTASSRKSYISCATCKELGSPKERCKHYSYLEPKVADSTDHQTETTTPVTPRARSATKASQRGNEDCIRYPRGCSNAPHPIHKMQLPLLSGLRRSKNIDAIVSRLYRPTKAIPIYGRKSSLVYGSTSRSKSAVLPRGKRREALPPPTV